MHCSLDSICHVGYLPWLFVATFILSGVMMVRAEMRLHALARAQGKAVFDDALVERPWLFVLHFRTYMGRALRLPYERLEGGADDVRREYLGWRWSMLASFVALFITSALFWR